MLFMTWCVMAGRHGTGFGLSEPIAIDASAERLKINWSDGGSSVYPAKFLRGICACANCVSEATGERTVDISRIPGDIVITSAQPTGHYAVSLAFSDGHGTGIYSFEMLRRQQGGLDCPEC